MELPATLALAPVVAAVKTGSTRWIRRSFSHRAGFEWQEGYAAFSVTPHDDARLLDDLRHQDVRHRDRDFTREYLALLELHQVQYDLREALE